jgi:CDP-paratose 2-epimerase
MHVTLRPHTMKHVFVTGSNGLIGSEMISHFHGPGWAVHGVDNNMRADFFGASGDTRWNQQRLARQFSHSHIMSWTSVPELRS